LFSVPLSASSKDTSWIQNPGQSSLIWHVKSLISKDCFEVDTDWSSTITESDINDLTKSYSFSMAIKEKEYKKLCLEKIPSNGNAKLLGLSMPFVDVEELEYEDTQPDQYTCFFHPKNLYRERHDSLEKN